MVAFDSNFRTELFNEQITPTIMANNQAVWTPTAAQWAKISAGTGDHHWLITGTGLGVKPLPIGVKPLEPYWSDTLTFKI